MYDLHQVEERIMSIASTRGLSKNKLLENVGLNKSVFDNMKKGQIPSVDKIHKIADYLDVTTDYLLGRTGSPYCVLVSEYPNETYTVDIGKLFQQNDIVRRFASRMFEAYSDIYNVNSLLEDLLNKENNVPDNCNHIEVVLKYTIIVLGETIALLKATYAPKYIDAIKALTKNNIVKEKYNSLIASIDDRCNGDSEPSDARFILDLRNLIAHYDHEQNDVYPNIVNAMQKYNLKVERNHLLYKKDFLTTHIFVEYFKAKYKSKKADDAITEIVNICERVLSAVHTCLKIMLDEFFENYNLEACMLEKNENTKGESKVAVLPSVVSAGTGIKENTASDVKSNTVKLNNTKVRLLPLFESVSAGFGAFASDEIQEYIPCYIENDYEAENSMCIKVEGDSMSPKIENGDIVQVLKQTSVDSGSIAVVLIDGEEGLVKRVVYGKTWIELHSLNPNYPVQRFEKEEVLRVSVVGLVKKIIKDI